MIDKVIAHLDQQRDASIERLFDFLRIPCVSTDPEARGAIRQGAEWVRKFFADAGIEAEIVETAGHPSIIADTGPADGGPTVLVYGHYDVQPTGDLSLWKSGPFEPQVREGRIYARGASDDKGQVLAHMLAAAAWMKIAGKPPIRLKFVVEGEEEIGSPNLAPMIERHAKRLACDYVCLSDTAKFDADTPAITYGTKGMIYKEIVYLGAAGDLHSGSFGGTVPNPGNAIATLVAKMKDGDNRVVIPGFYDDVAEPTKTELESLRGLPFDDGKYAKSIGARGLAGEKGYSTMERRWLRPTLDVNGLLTGFTGEGAMTVLPAKAMAKVSMRLVPNQDPDKVSAAFDRFVAENTPEGIEHKVTEFTRCAAYVCPLENPGMRRAAAAVAAGFGAKPAFIREGGTLPILPMFKRVLGAESIMLGFALPNCNAHAPNEFFVVNDFTCGTKAAACLSHEMAKS